MSNAFTVNTVCRDVIVLFFSFVFVNNQLLNRLLLLVSFVYLFAIHHNQKMCVRMFNYGHGCL